jgi:hypothetical protein
MFSHEQAMEAANFSVFYCQKDFQVASFNYNLQQDDQLLDQLREAAKYYAIALYNQATELQFLNKYKKSN